MTTNVAIAVLLAGLVLAQDAAQTGPAALK